MTASLDAIILLILRNCSYCVFGSFNSSKVLVAGSKFKLVDVEGTCTCSARIVPVSNSARIVFKYLKYAPMGSCLPVICCKFAVSKSSSIHSFKNSFAISAFNPLSGRSRHLVYTTTSGCSSSSRLCSLIIP